MMFHRLFFWLLLISVITAASAPSALWAAHTKAQADAVSSVALLDDIAAGTFGLEQRTSKMNQSERDFALGYLRFRRGEWREADELLQRAAPALPLIADHILFYRATAADRLGRAGEALSLLDELAAACPDTVWNLEARLERARAQIALGRGREARPLLEEIRRRAGPEQAFEASRLIAQAMIAEGDAAAAGFARQLAIAADSESRLRDLAELMQEVKRRFGDDIAAWLEEPFQQYRLAQSFAAASQWDEAAARLEKIVGRGLDPAMRTEAKWLLAKSDRWIHRYDDAIRLMEELLGDPNARAFFDSLQNTLATTYTKKNDYAKAIALREQMMRGAAPGSARAAEMAYKIAFLVMDEGKYDEAIALWRQALGARGGSKRENAEWYLAWSFFMAGRFPDAVDRFNGMLKVRTKRSGIHDRLLYWKGRALEEMGRGDEARATFGAVIRDHPHGYYAELASRRLKGERRSALEFALISEGPARHASPAEDIAVSSRPLRHAGVAGGGEAGGHLVRAAFFDRLGLHEEAAREVRAARGEERGVLFALSKRDFAHDVAYRMAEEGSHALLMGDPPSGEVGRAIWEAAYPRAYDPLVERLVQRGDVDPRFVWSIMRNESVFKPEVVSPAGAVGLMQLMPATANRLAPEIGRAGVARRELFRPATNIALGVAYLKKLAAMFPGNPAAWAASYNAGEEAVARWIANGRRSDIEEWIEEIPYDETNLYVKKVMLSYWKYQRLYGK